MVQRQTENIEQSRLLQRMVIDVMRKYGCRNVKDIFDKLQHLDKSITFEEIRHAIQQLNHDNKITLLEPQVQGSFLNYITNLSRGASFWLTIIVTGLTLATIYLAPQVAPWSMLRIAVGAAFVLFVPGYSLLQLLFPTKDIDVIERIVLSIGLSLAVAPLIGLTLNYSPWGIRLAPIVASLSATSIALGLGSTYRSFLLRRKLP